MRVSRAPQGRKETLNEEATIASVIGRIPRSIEGVAKVEVVVVDDGSTDKTAELSRQAGVNVVSHPQNMGVDKAYATGIGAALKLGADIIVNMDSDGQFNPEDVSALIRPILEEGYGFVTCTRFGNPDYIPKMPWIKKWGNRMMCRLVKRIDEVTDGLYGPDGAEKNNFGLSPKKTTHGGSGPLDQIVITKTENGTSPASIFVDWDTEAGAAAYQIEWYTDSAMTQPIGNAAGVRAVFGSRRNIGHWMKRSDARISKFYNCFFIDKIIANCEAARQSVIEQENANPDDMIVIPNGIDLDRFKHIPPWMPKPNGLPRKGGLPRKVGMVGNLREVKGPDIFIRAAKIVLDQYPHTQFEIAGGGEQKPYQKLIDDLGLGENVCLLGPVSDIPAFLTTLDIAVLPSRAEGFSNALIEYMAAGRPIVATDVGGNAELIHSRIEGLTVPANLHDVLAQALLEFFDMPDLAAECASRASSSSAGLGVDSVTRRFSNIVRTSLRVSGNSNHNGDRQQ
jgi:glycosyltransferase involved in cell wall biosynthesis